MSKYVKDNDISTTRINYIDEDFYRANKDKLVYIAKTINNALKDYPHFDGIEYDDVGGSTIQVMYYNTETYEGYPTGYGVLKKDLSNSDEVINEIINDFKKGDNEENIKFQNKYFKDGDKNEWR